MLTFSDIPVEYRLLITLVLFFSTMMSLGLCLYRYLGSRKISRTVPSALLFVFQIILLSWLSASMAGIRTVYTVPVSWFLLPAGIIIAMAYAVISIVLEYKRRRREITPSSIKEAFDNLNTGICFSDAEDKIVLINYRMGESVSALTGKYPRYSADITSSLREYQITGEDVVLMPDGRVWRMSRAPLSEPKLSGYTQTTAQDITELYQANLSLAKENERLRQVNVETQAMMERLADRIRKEETLALKQRIHDDIGTSLISIRKIMRGADEDMDVQLARLKNAVSYFTTRRAEQEISFDAVTEKARKLGVDIRLCGTLPRNTACRAVVLSALSECVTNCERHAGGDEVILTVTPSERDLFVEITNNGAPPQNPVKEGGGLATIRRLAENIGGETEIISEPCFKLKLRLPKGGTP